ncbi:MAG: response regulator [Desulfobacteraceae bacterium]
MKNQLLEGRKLLIVDDEPDVLETIEALLPMCQVTKATSFEEAKEFMENQYLDIAILDIMGVRGFDLLKLAKEKGIIPVMLTAHALSTESTVKSFKEGAASYVPKEEMQNIDVYLTDVLEAQEKGKSFWWRWLDRFASYYDKKFGEDWQKSDKDFWEKFKYYDRL